MSEQTSAQDTYRTIRNSSSGYFRDRGSKFHAHAYPVSSEEEIREIIATLKKDYHDASHYCYAWKLGTDDNYYRINDDGEPSGSAGKPIYGQILSFNLTDILIVVIRYFGGTKLGIPGLINAYRTSAREAIENAQIITRLIETTCRIRFQYPDMNQVMRILKEEKADIKDSKYEMSCTITFAIRNSRAKKTIHRLKKIPSLTLTRD